MLGFAPLAASPLADDGFSEAIVVSINLTSSVSANAKAVKLGQVVVSASCTTSIDASRVTSSSVEIPCQSTIAAVGVGTFAGSSAVSGSANVAATAAAKRFGDSQILARAVVFAFGAKKWENTTDKTTAWADAPAASSIWTEAA
jgi:hypothetical protein